MTNPKSEIVRDLSSSYAGLAAIEDEIAKKSGEANEILLKYKKHVSPPELRDTFIGVPDIKPEELPSLKTEAIELRTTIVDLKEKRDNLKSRCQTLEQELNAPSEPITPIQIRVDETILTGTLEDIATTFDLPQKKPIDKKLLTPSPRPSTLLKEPIEPIYEKKSLFRRNPFAIAATAIAAILVAAGIAYKTVPYVHTMFEGRVAAERDNAVVWFYDAKQTARDWNHSAAEFFDETKSNVKQTYAKLIRDTTKTKPEALEVIAAKPAEVPVVAPEPKKYEPITMTIKTRPANKNISDAVTVVPDSLNKNLTIYCDGSKVSSSLKRVDIKLLVNGMYTNYTATFNYSAPESSRTKVFFTYVQPIAAKAKN